jgi:hypothetical protein
LCHEDFEKLVVDSDLKSLMPALNAFLEQINEEIGMACVASDLFRLIFESRGKG